MSETNPEQWAREQARKIEAEEAERLRGVEEMATAVHRKNVEENRAEEERRNPKVNIDEVRARKGSEELEQHREAQRNLWISHGGTEEEFKAAWPGIKQRYLEQKSREALGRVSSPFD